MIHYGIGLETTVKFGDDGDCLAVLVFAAMHPQNRNPAHLQTDGARPMGVNRRKHFQYAHIRASNANARLSSDNIWIAGSNIHYSNYQQGHTMSMAEVVGCIANN